MKRLLKGVAVCLALLMVTLLVLYLNRTEPYGSIPGKRLVGEEETEPVEDWSFTRQYRRVTVEVRPENPYSVYAGYFLYDGVLHISSAGSRWARFLIQNPNMRIRLGEKIYPVRGVRVEEPQELERVMQAYLDKYPGRTPEEAARRWFFRIESR